MLSSFREAEYRRSLALVELLGFNADILCLQEVDEKAFHLYFEPQLQAAGLAWSPVCSPNVWHKPQDMLVSIILREFSPIQCHNWGLRPIFPCPACAFRILYALSLHHVQILSGLLL